MAENALKNGKDWKDKLSAVAAETGGIFAVILDPNPPCITVVYDPRPDHPIEGLRALFEAYKPKEVTLALKEADSGSWFLDLANRGELLYSYNLPAFKERVRALDEMSEKREEEIRKRPRDRDQRLIGPTIINSIYFMVGYGFLVLAVAQHPRMAWLLKPLGLLVSLGVGLFLLRFFLKSLDRAAGSAIDGVFGWKAKAANSYSREISMARRGERQEAIKLLEDHFSIEKDPQALREALKVALQNPRMTEDCRRLSQDLLRLKTLSAEEKALLKKDLAALG